MNQKLSVIKNVLTRLTGTSPLWLLLLSLMIATDAGCIKSATPEKNEPNSPPAVDSTASAATKTKPSASTTGEEFTVVAYNVEHLFDIDGQAIFDDYKPALWGPAQLLVKVKNIAKVLQTFRDGKGPQIVLFQEFEHDLTGGDNPPDYAALLQKYQSVNLETLLGGEVSEEIKDLPAAFFLLKALSEAGLEPYEVSVAEFRPDPLGREVAHVNATFSQFPIVKSTTHQSPGARGTLEVEHQIGKHKLHTFNSHWKSGASNAQEELLRLGNAKVVRDRLNEIFKSDPQADVVLGGDFNSQYNQRQRYPNMKKTAINTVLGSQGDELAVCRQNGPDLYNLWYELAPSLRRSDAYQGYWGTLMNIMVARGLYDYRGIQYVDNSFQAIELQGLNAQIETGLPQRWRTVLNTGVGFSDHLPIAARFRVVEDDDTQTFMQLDSPGVEGESLEETKGVKADYTAVKSSNLKKTSELGSDSAVQKTELMGQLFLVEAKVTAEKPLRIQLFEDDFKLWSFDEKLRLKIYSKFPVGAKVSFIGELDFHQGMWQFLIHDESWLEPNAP